MASIAILVKPKWQPSLLLAGYTEFSCRVVLMLSTLKKFCLTATDEVCVGCTKIFYSKMTALHLASKAPFILGKDKRGGKIDR